MRRLPFALWPPGVDDTNPNGLACVLLLGKYGLLADAELADNVAVAIGIILLEVIKHGCGAWRRA